MPWQRDIAADIQCIALVVIERTESRRQGEVGKSTGNGAAPLGDLIGVCEARRLLCFRSRSLASFWDI